MSAGGAWTGVTLLAQRTATARWRRTTVGAEDVWTATRNTFVPVTAGVTCTGNTVPEKVWKNLYEIVSGLRLLRGLLQAQSKGRTRRSITSAAKSIQDHLSSERHGLRVEALLEPSWLLLRWLALVHRQRRMVEKVNGQYLSMKLKAVPLTFQEAKDFITKYHRHHKPPTGWKFGIACYSDTECLGVVVVSRPVARMLDDGETCEVTRLCTNGAKNVCSFLYSRARRCAQEMGYSRIITYILESEPGISLKAAGWTFVRLAGGGSWSRPSRARVDKAPLERKQLWEAKLTA